MKDYYELLEEKDSMVLIVIIMCVIFPLFGIIYGIACFMKHNTVVGFTSIIFSISALPGWFILGWLIMLGVTGSPA